MVFKKRREFNTRLDRIGAELVRASSLTETEAEEALSPWLFTRLRARIAQEGARAETGERWYTFLTVIRHAVPATALATIVAFGSYLWASPNVTQPAVQFSDQALFATSDAGVERVVLADRIPLSSDELMETIITGERETAK